MSCSYKILPQFGLVHIRFAGEVCAADSLEALQRFAEDPKGSPDLNQLLDMRDVTGLNLDVMEMLKVHARKAEIFIPAEQDRLFVHLAPSEIALKIAGFTVRSWEHVPGITHRVVRTEEQALQVLGLRESSIDALVQQQV
ncbi:hypothetical protein [Oceanicola sp. S124]|uniref:hypothetical protein n=1 Tax=Oceanicola sp. S124 TaxID=1042378 RepID=UPI0002558D90|nr:hypothetical protein [Oceanicola sp. S124]